MKLSMKWYPQVNSKNYINKVQLKCTEKTNKIMYYAEDNLDQFIREKFFLKKNS